jgi:hypothetical protein
MIQFSDPDSKTAVEATFKLAGIATLNSAMAAHSPRTASLAEGIAARSDWIAVLRAANPDRLPSFSAALESLGSKTFQSYRPRGAHKKGTNPEAVRITDWFFRQIEIFWQSVIDRNRKIPPTPDHVRFYLLSPENRLRGSEWAKKLFDSLPKENGVPFEVFDGGIKQAFFESQLPKIRRPKPDRAKKGFVKFAGERFNPLLKSERQAAERSYEILMRERIQKNISSH